MSQYFDHILSYCSGNGFVIGMVCRKKIRKRTGLMEINREVCRDILSIKKRDKGNKKISIDHLIARWEKESKAIRRRRKAI